jgi:hypothetical protein
MLILDAVTKSLKIVLAGNVTTNQLQVTTHWIDITTTTFTPGSTDTVTNQTTAVEIVGAPAASTQRVIKAISVHNADTAAATVIIQYVSATGTRQPIKVTLQTLENLSYEDGMGWQVLDANGGMIRGTNVDNTAYGVGWSGKTTIAPSEKIVYDQMQLKLTGSYASAAEITTGTEAAKAIAPVQLVVPLFSQRGNYEYLRIMNNVTNPTYQMDVNAIIGVNGQNYVPDITIDITASGANGLATGAEEASTWYYISIATKADKTTCGLFSKTSSPVLPAGYIQSVLVGAVYNNASSNFNLMTQYGNVCACAAVQIIDGGTSATWAATGAVTAIVPPTATKVYGVGTVGGNTSSAVAVFLYLAAKTDGLGVSYLGGDIASTAQLYLGGSWRVQYSGDNLLAYKVTKSAGTAYAYAYVTGWEY